MKATMLFFVAAILCIAGIDSSINYIKVEQSETTYFVCESNVTNECVLVKQFSDFYFDKHHPDNSRFQVKNPETCIIEILETQVSDSGNYQCEVNDGEKKDFSLFVTVEPKDLQLLANGKSVLNNSKTLIDSAGNENVTFTCQANQSLPAAIFSWYIDDKLIIERNEEAHIRADKLYDSVSSVSTPFECGKEKKIKCSIYHNSHKHYNNVKMLIGTFENTCGNETND